ncbi:MAG: sulfurtransferase TusA family protein [Synergistaceae bacterium]|nr:sulfurtransferase TusA family protein [Synergistaceae bacterium]
MLDARGLSCPQPVLMLKKAMTGGGEKFEIIVDNTAAKENITRFARNLGYNVAADEKEGEYILTVTKQL